jgi:hypothetical protein
MLRFIPCFFIALLLLGEACKKEQVPNLATNPTDTIPDIIGLGECTCIKNDVHWSPKAYAAYHPDRKDVFIMDAGSTNRYLRSFSITVSDIPTKKGKYNIEFYKTWDVIDFIPQMAIFVSQDYDQLIGTYSIDTTRNDHFIEVVSFDSIAGTVQGRFQFFTKEKHGNAPNSWGLEPKINLTEGKFHLKLQ